MKKLKLIFALLFTTAMFSSPSYSEWTETSVSAGGNVFYIDFSSIKKNNGYVYYWQVLDYLKPTEYGDLSSKRLYELDCNIPRKERSISASYHTQPMGNGAASTSDNTVREWTFYPPSSPGQIVLDEVCSR
jgi:hypothetical protein